VWRASHALVPPLPGFVFNASTSQSTLATINATGKIRTAFCKFPPNESASRPTISGGHMSPKRRYTPLAATVDDDVAVEVVVVVLAFIAIISFVIMLVVVFITVTMVKMMKLETLL
jgi:hypothetical protein